MYGIDSHELMKFCAKEGIYNISRSMYNIVRLQVVEYHACFGSCHPLALCSVFSVLPLTHIETNLPPYTIHLIDSINFFRDLMQDR